MTDNTVSFSINLVSIEFQFIRNYSNFSVIIPMTTFDKLKKTLQREVTLIKYLRTKDLKIVNW